MVEIAAAGIFGASPYFVVPVWAGPWPSVPIDRIVAQLNLDMVGRSKAPGDTAAANAGLTGPDEVYLVGASRLSRELRHTDMWRLTPVAAERLYGDVFGPENVEVVSSHVGMVANPLVLKVVVDRLQQDPAAWQPFARTTIREIDIRKSSNG